MPALSAAREGDFPGAFVAFLRGVGGEGYRDELSESLGPDGIGAAMRDSVSFFADELPAVAGWVSGEAEGRDVRAPTLVVDGDRSAPWFHEDVELLTDLVPRAEMATLPGLDHLAPLTHPAELGRLITGFVDRMATGRPAGPGGVRSTAAAARRRPATACYGLQQAGE